MKLLIIYLLIMNAAGLFFMLADKQKAIRGAWRIPEKVLLGVGLLGGSLGCILGMRLFRHKTKHLQFSLGLPVLLVMQLVLFTWLYIKIQGLG